MSCICQCFSWNTRSHLQLGLNIFTHCQDTGHNLKKPQLKILASLILKEHQCPRGQDKRVPIHTHLPRLYNVFLFNIMYTPLNKKNQQSEKSDWKVLLSSLLLLIQMKTGKLRTRDHKLLWVLQCKHLSKQTKQVAHQRNALEIKIPFMCYSRGRHTQNRSEEMQPR